MVPWYLTPISPSLPKPNADRYRTETEILKYLSSPGRDRFLLIGVERRVMKVAQFRAAEEQYYNNYRTTRHFLCSCPNPNLGLQSLSSLPRVVVKLSPNHSQATSLFLLDTPDGRIIRGCQSRGSVLFQFGELVSYHGMYKARYQSFAIHSTHMLTSFTPIGFHSRCMRQARGTCASLRLCYWSY